MTNNGLFDLWQPSLNALLLAQKRQRRGIVAEKNHPLRRFQGLKNRSDFRQMFRSEPLLFCQFVGQHIHLVGGQGDQGRGDGK